MSIDAEFSRVAFPVLADRATSSAEAAASARGHAAGYFAGMRSATEDAAQEIAQRRRADEDAARAAQDRVDRVVTALSSATLAVRDRTATTIDDAHDALAAAAIDLAEAIIGHEISRGEGSAVSAMTRALAGVNRDSVQVIKLNPLDLAELDADDRASEGFRLVGDAGLRRGDAITEFSDGWLDARIATAVARVREALSGGAA